MDLRDFIVTPIVIILVYWVAYMVRPRVCDTWTYRYFFPALTVRIIGALAVGFIYQFYYEGGDTYAYHTHGSRQIWEAFIQSPAQGLQLLFAKGQYGPGYWDYAEKIWYYRDQQSYSVIRVAAILDFFTFSSYGGTSVLFAALAFMGAWMMFLTFYSRHPAAHKTIAVSCLFVPSVVFWGSGIFKDTLTLAAIGSALYCIYIIFLKKKFSVALIFGLILSIWVIFSIKKYILLCFLPAILVWLFGKGLSRIKSAVAKALLIPVSLVPVLLVIYYTILKVGESDPRYSVNKISETVMITAYDIRYGWGARMGEGSGYTLGVLDGTWQSMIKLAPSAVNVSLFRPYLWEVRSPLMLFSAIEGMVLLILTLFVLFRSGLEGLRHLKKPEVILCLGFSLVFAFAVGVSTYNFGSLSRYKIPLLPFYSTGIGLLYYYSSKR